MPTIQFPTTEVEVTLQPSGQVLTGPSAVALLQHIVARYSAIPFFDEEEGTWNYLVNHECICSVTAAMTEGTEEVCIDSAQIEPPCINVWACPAPVGGRNFRVLSREEWKLENEAALGGKKIEDVEAKDIAKLAEEAVKAAGVNVEDIVEDKKGETAKKGK